MMADLTIAGEDAVFGQTGHKNGKFRCGIWFRSNGKISWTEEGT